MSTRPSPRKSILRVLSDFPEGIGRRFISDTLQISYGSVSYWLDRFVEEGIARREYGLVRRPPYYWYLTYYLMPVIPPSEVGYLHQTLVYDVETDTEGMTMSISITFDYDSVDDKEVKDRLKRIALLIASAWVRAKFTNIPSSGVWAEEHERPAPRETVALLKELKEGYTRLYYKWTWRRGDGVSENSEGDMDWEDELPLTGSLGERRQRWFDVRKGRVKGIS